MKSDNLIDAIGKIDDEFIEGAAARKIIKRKKRKIWILPTAAALCLLICVGVALLPSLFEEAPIEIPTDGQATNEQDTGDYDPPIYEGAYLSAEDIAKIFGGIEDGVNGATSSYQKVYTAADRPLPRNPIPDEEYINIYKKNSMPKDLSKTEFEAFVNEIYPKLCTSLGIDPEEFQRHDFERDDELTASYRMVKDGRIYIIDFDQQSGKDDYFIGNAINRVWIDNGAGGQISLDGKKVQVDQRQSEEEMLKSLEWVRDALFEIFGRSFDSADIVYNYGETHEYGVKNIYVYYYNKNGSINIGDRIVIHFDNYANSSNETESIDIIDRCSIAYYGLRVPIEDHYTAVAKCRLIDIEEAEELLFNGYVFGGHSCPICMASQEKVSFDGYDFVSFEYVGFPSYLDNPCVIPFYKFYKRIDDAPNGNITYAATYVCAIEVSGMKEYFEAQEKNHGGFVEYVTVE